MDYQSAALGLALAQSRYQALVDAKTQHDTASAGLANLQSAAAAALQQAQAAMGSASPTTIGTLSVIDTRSQTERQAGKGAAIDYIKANPSCAEADAITAWETGAKATLPAGLTNLLNNPAGLLEAYIANALAMGATKDNTWASFAALVVATDKTALLAM